MPTLFSLDELNDARDIVAAVMAPTPQYRWPLLAQRAGVNVWVKHENHTPTGAFKVRGGLVFIEALRRAGQLPNGFITATRGNHGQSVPYAASRVGVPVSVVVPQGNSVEKNRAMTAWGAELIVHGSDFDEARVEAARLAEERQLAFAPSFHPELVRGVATYAHELLTAVPDLAAVYVPVGMGSGICAVITVRDLLGLDTEVIGVVSSNAPAYQLSVAAGKLVETNTANTFADGVAVRVPVSEALEVITRGAARIVDVSEARVAAAMRALFEDTHNVAEGAGAAGLAALLAEQDESRYGPDQQVAVILTGGNVDSAVFARVLNGEVPDA